MTKGELAVMVGRLAELEGIDRKAARRLLGDLVEREGEGNISPRDLRVLREAEFAMIVYRLTNKGIDRAEAIRGKIETDAQVDRLVQLEGIDRFAALELLSELIDREAEGNMSSRESTLLEEANRAAAARLAKFFAN
jgi:hypothetical protein